MGREAYLYRLAFGRSYTDSPEYEVLRTHPGILPYGSSTIPPRPTTAAAPQQLYNERGHPVNRNSRRYARALRAAQNDVLAAVGVVVRNGCDTQDQPKGPTPQELATLAQDEHMSGLVMSYIAPYVEKFLLHWLHALKHKALVYPMLSNMSAIAFAKSEIATLGYRHFFFSGLSTYFIQSLLRYPDWLSFAFEGIDVIVRATVSSSRKRTAYEAFKPVVRELLEQLMKIMALPFELYYLHKTLGVAQTASILPTWKLINSALSALAWPFYGRVDVGGSRPILPVPASVWLLTYNVGTSILVTLIFRTMRDSVLRPASKQWLAKQRSNRKTLSETIEQLFEGDGKPWALTRCLSPLFSFMMDELGWGWSRPEQERTPLAELPSDNELEEQARALAWPAFDPDILAYIPPEALTRTLGEAVTSVIHDGVSNTQWEAGEEGALEQTAAADVGPDETAPRRRSPTASTTNPPSPTTTSDATIRITSSDAYSGVVNLEIGLPEPQPQGTPANTRARRRRSNTAPRRDSDPFISNPPPITAPGPPPSDTENHPPSHLIPAPPQRVTNAPDPSPLYSRFRAAISRQRRKLLQQRARHPRHQRVTMLSLYMSDNLASLVTSKLVNVLTLPWRAWMLREVAVQVMGAGAGALTTHQVYGAVGSVGLGLAGGGGAVGWTAGMVGKVAMYEALQMLLEMGIWMGEWAVVRSIGLRRFRWGEV